MSQRCEISTCDATSLTTCVCCKQNLCREHFVEHDYLLRPKLNDLTEQIDQLLEQFQCLDIQKLSNDSHVKLDQWRFNSYKVIDEFYQRKSTEFNHYINQTLNQHEKDINDLRLKIAKMIYVQQTTNENMNLLTNNIQTLQKQMKYIEQISTEVNIRPLVIIDQSIDGDLSNLCQNDLSKLSSPYQRIERIPLSSHAMANNTHYLLIHQNSNLYLIDKQISIVRTKKWFHDAIRDMCWSQILNSFFVLTLHHIYQVEMNTLWIQHVDTIDGQFWQSCTCSPTSLYLVKDTWNSSVEEFSLESSIEFIKHYRRIETKDQKQRIDSIEYSDGKLILAINDQIKQEIFIELRSITTFDQLWLCPLNIHYSERKMQCCLYVHDTWLIADWGTASLFHLNKDGKVQNVIEYEYEICYINLFQSNKLVISTDRSIHFHQL